MPKETKPQEIPPKEPPRSDADPTPAEVCRPNGNSRDGDWIEGDEGCGSAYLSNPERDDQSKAYLK